MEKRRLELMAEIMVGNPITKISPVGTMMTGEISFTQGESIMHVSQEQIDATAELLIEYWLWKEGQGCQPSATVIEAPRPQNATRKPRRNPSPPKNGRGLPK